MEELRWHQIKKRKVFSSRWFDVTKNEVELRGNVLIDDYYVIENQNSVMILALDEDNNVILKQEYRLPVDEILIELPAGAIEDTDDNALNTAKRGLKEETVLCGRCLDIYWGDT